MKTSLVVNVLTKDVQYFSQTKCVLIAFLKFIFLFHRVDSV